MRHSLSLFAAACLAASATAAPQTGTGRPGAPAAPQIIHVNPEPEPARPFRLGDRIRSLFSSRPLESRSAVVPASARLQPLPAAASMPSSPIPQAAVVSTSPGIPTSIPPRGSALSANDLDKVGHEKDYSWITGRLSRTSRGWVLHYAGPHEVDPHGGSLPLTGHPELANYREGDLICVHGTVTSRGLTSRRAVYQVNQTSLIERGSR